MRSEPLIVVKDVEKSSQFYQKVLACESAHGGPDYEMLMSGKNLILQLHREDTHEHPEMYQAELENGNGVVLNFITDEFDAAVERIKASKAEIVAEAHVNPNAHRNEICFRDLDGYLVVVANNFYDAKK